VGYIGQIRNSCRDLLKRPKVAEPKPSGISRSRGNAQPAPDHPKPQIVKVIAAVQSAVA